MAEKKVPGRNAPWMFHGIVPKIKSIQKQSGGNYRKIGEVYIKLSGDKGVQNMEKPKSKSWIQRMQEF